MGPHRLTDFRLPRSIRLAVTALVAIIMVTALVKCREQLPADLPRPQLAPLASALGLWMVYLVANAWAWVLILRWLGTPVATSAGIRMRIRCEALRWLPGSVWNYGVRSLQASTLGVPPLTSVISLLAELGFALLASAIATACCCVAYSSAFRLAAFQLREQLPSWPMGGAIVIILALGGVALMAPRWCRKVKTGLKLCAEAKTLRDFGWLEAFALQGLYLALAAIGGLAVMCIIRSFDETAQIPLLAVVGANCVAWLIGFLAIFAPGGLVIREGVLTAVLAVWLPLEIAVSVAILWRILQIFGELVMLAITCQWRTDSPRNADGSRDGWSRATRENALFTKREENATASVMVAGLSLEASSPLECGYKP